MARQNLIQMNKLGESFSEVSEEVRLNRRRKFIAWLVLQAVVPYLIVFLCWPAAQLLFNVSFAFEKNFIGADLLLAGGLLIAGIVVEIWSEQRINRSLNREGGLDVFLIISFLLPLVFLAGFGVFKSKSLIIEFQQGKPLDPTVHVCAWLCIVGGMFALTWSILTAFYAFRRFLAAELAEAKGRGE